MELNESNDIARPETPPKSDPAWLPAVLAAEEKQASNIVVLDLREVTSFTDQFIICTGSNPRQVQAIADEVRLKLKASGETPLSTEGYNGAQWILIDYSNFIVHIFSVKAREYYNLERLWRHARTMKLPVSHDPTVASRNDAMPPGE